MSSESLIASGYALAWIAVLGVFAYAAVKMSRPQRKPVKITAKELYKRSADR